MSVTIHVDERRRRHSRSIAAGYSIDVLDRAHIAVIGAGALGQNVLLNLTLAGIGTVTIVDFDVFEDHNITRSPLFPRPDQLAATGWQKALGVAARMREMASNDRLQVRCYTRPVQRVPLDALLSCDVIISAVDSPRARRWLAATSRLIGVPLVEGGFDGHAFNISSFSASPADPCLGCLSPDAEPGFSCTERARLLAGSALVPALQTTAALAGAVMAEHAIAICHADESLALNHVHYGDVRNLRVRSAAITASAICDIGHRRAGIEPAPSVPTSWAELAALIDPDDEIVLPDTIVLSMECPMCGFWCRPNVPEQEWRGWPFCSSCMDRGHPSDKAYPAVDLVDRVRAGDIAHRLADVRPDVLPLERGGAVVAERAGNGPRLVLFPGSATPDEGKSRTV